jgi:hypothetical protein
MSKLAKLRAFAQTALTKILQVDVETLSSIVRVIPSLMPYILDHYKEQMAGLVVGTSLSQVSQLRMLIFDEITKFRFAKRGEFFFFFFLNFFYDGVALVKVVCCLWGL